MINIITGNIDSGKTTYLRNHYKKTKKGDGILCIKHFENETFIGYDLLHLKSGNKKSFIRKKENLPENWNKIFEIGIYSFSKKGYEFAEKILENIDNEPIYFDEIGPLEIIQKKGFYYLLRQNLDKELFLTVRESLFDDLLKTFNITKNINKITIE